MSSSLLDSLSTLITPDLIGKAASFLGESDGATSKGLGAVLPLVLGGVATKAGDQGFASTLFDLVSNPANDGSLLGNVGSLLSPSAASSPMGALGGRLLNSVFGDNLGGVGSALSSHAGVKSSTASSLLGVAAPLVLSVLGKATRSGGLNTSSLANLLLGQKSAITSALPGPLSGLDRFLAAPARPASYAAAAPAPVESKSSIWRWLIPLLIALAALWLLSSLFGRKEAPVETTPPPVATEPAPTTEPAPAPVEPSTEGATGAAPSANLYFEVDSADLPADATGGLEPVVAYLKANPSSMAVISGFHDPTGDAAKNAELAKNRAQAVANALEGAGVDASRIDLHKPDETTGSGSHEDARRVEVTVQ